VRLAQRDLWYCSRLPMARWFAAAGFLVSTQFVLVEALGPIDPNMTLLGSNIQAQTGLHLKLKSPCTCLFTVWDSKLGGTLLAKAPCHDTLFEGFIFVHCCILRWSTRRSDCEVVSIIDTL